MGRTVVRTLAAMLVGFIFSKLVEMALSSGRGQQLAARRGFGDLTTHHGIKLSQRYARDGVGIVINALGAIDELRNERDTTALMGKGWTWLRTFSYIWLALSSMAETLAEFLAERRQVEVKSAVKKLV